MLNRKSRIAERRMDTFKGNAYKGRYSGARPHSTPTLESIYTWPVKAATIIYHKENKS